MPNDHRDEGSTAAPVEDLAAAIRAGDLHIVYQPQVSADGRTLISVEALTRWYHPHAGWIPPSDFIAYAEANGLIEPLGAMVLERACRDACRWPTVGLAVNVSPLQFSGGELIDQIDDVLARTGFPASRLELEITEGAFFSDPERAARSMQMLRDRGVKIALDDFGTGYASLSYLRQLPWDKVKIDKSFVDDVSFVRSAAIVHAVVALAKAIGLKVCAEGVESAEQQRFLRLAGCHTLQGYRFSQPVDANRIDEMVAQGFAAWANLAA